MRQFSDLFFQMYNVSGPLQAPSRAGQYPAGAWQPPVDIYEREDAIIVIMELPGIKKEEVTVVVDQDLLKISGARPKRLPPGTDHVHQMEIPYGNFARYIRLPQRCDVERIEAEYTDGYLQIEIPRNALNE